MHYKRKDFVTYETVKYSICNVLSIYVQLNHTSRGKQLNSNCFSILRLEKI